MHDQESKTRNITLIPTTLKSIEIFKNVGIFVRKEMLINTCVLKCLLVSPIYRAPQR